MNGQVGTGSVDHPAQVWRRLTVLVRLLFGALLMSVGAWLGGFLIPLNYVSFEEQEAILRDVRDDLWRRASDLSAEVIDEIAREVASETVSSMRHRTRDRLQGPARIAFFLTGVAFAVSALVRAEPRLWDDVVTRVPLVGDVVPCILPAWQVVVETSAAGPMVAGSFHSIRTAKAAATHIARVAGATEATIQWDYGAWNTYREHAATQPFL